MEAAARRGVPRSALAEAVGLDPITLRLQDGRLPVSVVTTLYEDAARLTGDEAFGLHFLEGTDWYLRDALGYAGLAKNSLRDAFERLGPALRELQRVEVDMQVVGPRAHLTHRRIDGAAYSRHYTEAWVVGIVQFIALAIGQNFHPQLVTFRHSEPPDTSEHERILQSKVLFDQPANQVIFDASTLELPIAYSDARLSSVLDTHLEDLRSRSITKKRWADAVRHALRDGLAAQETTLRAVASRIGITPRTLQRHLESEAEAFSELLDEVRYVRALTLLSQSEMGTKEMAIELGYSDEAAFRRAFQRWTGCTVSEYRKRLSDGAG